ncbi:Protein of unknown function [Clostridium collagenovorans DSM 3089]|uniref:DUF2975 domain-containing protein n=1 Tax=Clostridium collagenovorans DSM 3089 TaxID=1121306 RepID=A0A1M5V0G7_9CLOT|nr:DUF2975 domain-containing protein [Clostridium collagenovorans]SHH68752.1 Protein of unknown function [Clostridium collagenovorans DSM 3089]
MNEHLTSKILNIILILGIILTFLLLLGTPLITTAFLKSAFGILNQNLILKISFCIYLCSIPYIMSLFSLKKICTLVIKNTPFSTGSVKCLKTIAVCAFSEILLIIFTSLFLKFNTNIFSNFLITPIILLISLICILIGLLCLVFSELFFNAKEIKEENDQTI